jgi:hypothetical protein
MVADFTRAVVRCSPGCGPSHVYALKYFPSPCVCVGPFGVYDGEGQTPPGGEEGAEGAAAARARR